MCGATTAASDVGRLDAEPSGVLAKHFANLQRMAVVTDDDVEVRRVAWQNRHSVTIPRDLRYGTSSDDNGEAHGTAFSRFDGLERFDELRLFKRR